MDVRLAVHVTIMNVNSMKAKLVIAMSKPLVSIKPMMTNHHHTHVNVTRDTMAMILNVSKVYYYFESNGLLTLARFKSF